MPQRVSGSMSKATPAFQFYPERFLVGTNSFTASEVGGYIRLLCHQWINGAVPGDSTKRLAPIMGISVSGAKSAWAIMQHKFDRGDDGLWRNGMMERVRSEQSEYRERSRANGGKGGRPRNNLGVSKHDENEPKQKPRNNLGVSETTTFDNLEITTPISNLSISDTSKNDVSEPKPHPVKAFLTLHESLFVELYGQKPAKYSDRDAKHAKDATDFHGEERAHELLRQFFRSSDRFIAGSGHPIGVFHSVQNKLIAELSRRGLQHQDAQAKAAGVEELKQFREEMQAKRDRRAQQVREQQP
jgi:uncharacterized protein YdaU (DUF1376 family)